MIDQHGSIHHFTITRINPRRSLRVSHPDRTITHAGIFYIVRIEFRIIFREVIRLHGIFKTDLFKSLVPNSHSGMNRGFPLVRECIIDIIHDRLHRFYQFAPLISFHILRLKIPTIDIIHIFHSILFVRNNFFAGNKITDSGIGQPGTHSRFLRQ